MAGRDIVVIGASLGGVAALKRLAKALPADMPSALLAVQHLSPDFPSVLDFVLSQAGPLKAGFATDGGLIKAGNIYLAPPDRHLLVLDDHLQLSRGPRENRTRPAVDALFRSAAVAKGPRVIGVILTGLLDDGAAGMDAVKRCGGVTVVQDPKDAEHPGMPKSVLNSGIEVDYCLPLDEIAPLLVRLARTEAPQVSTVPQYLKIEVDMLQKGYMDPGLIGRNGSPSSFVCPECGGSLYQIEHGKTLRYRCRIGHAYSAKALMADQAEAVEKALVVAARSLDERSKLFARMAKDMAGRKHETMAREYQKQSEDLRGQEELLRDQLLKGTYR